MIDRRGSTWPPQTLGGLLPRLTTEEWNVRASCRPRIGSSAGAARVGDDKFQSDYAQDC
jgi:hypothetical protein